MLVGCLAAQASHTNCLKGNTVKPIMTAAGIGGECGRSKTLRAERATKITKVTKVNQFSLCALRDLCGFVLFVFLIDFGGASRQTDGCSLTNGKLSGSDCLSDFVQVTFLCGEFPSLRESGVSSRDIPN